MTRQRKIYPFTPWGVGVEFENNFIFYSQFKSFWFNHISHGLVKNDIVESAREAADLFTVATEIKRIVQDNMY